MNEVVAMTLAVFSDILVVITLPLQIRILVVVLFPKRKINLDPSFHTLIIHATIVNLIYALDFCTIQEPASLGIFFDAYQILGPYLAKINMIKTTVILPIGAILHLVLSTTRLTAIIVPMRHARIWEGKKISYICTCLWIIAAVIAIPLLFPNATTQNYNRNVFGGVGIEFGLGGDVSLVYSIGSAAVAAVVELLSILEYIALLAKLNAFRKYSLGTEESVKRTTQGVIRTTIASIFISMGSWLIIFFVIFLYAYKFAVGHSPFTKLEYSVIFKLLNAINNILTPWVIFLGFPKMIVIRYEISNTGTSNRFSSRFLDS